MRILFRAVISSEGGQGRTGSLIQRCQFPGQDVFLEGGKVVFQPELQGCLRAVKRQGSAVWRFRISAFSRMATDNAVIPDAATRQKRKLDTVSCGRFEVRIAKLVFQHSPNELLCHVGSQHALIVC